MGVLASLATSGATPERLTRLKHGTPFGSERPRSRAGLAARTPTINYDTRLRGRSSRTAD